MDMAWTHGYPFVFFNEWILRRGYCMVTSTREYKLGRILADRQNNLT